MTALSEALRTVQVKGHRMPQLIHHGRAITATFWTTSGIEFKAMPAMLCPRSTQHRRLNLTTEIIVEVWSQAG